MAGGWNKWWDTIETAGQPVSDRMIEMAGIGPGAAVLDIATGVGEPAITAAHAVAPDGHVIATDQAAEMLRHAEARARSLGLGNIEFRTMDAEALDFDAATFDAALCRWGLMFLPDLGAAVGRIRKLLRTGGRFSAAAWGPMESMPMINLSGQVLNQRLPLEQPPSELGPFRLCAAGALESVLADAGFHDVTGEHLTATFTFDSPESYARCRREITTLDGQLREHYSNPDVDAGWQAVIEAARRYRDADGRVRMACEAICAVGTA